MASNSGGGGVDRRLVMWFAVAFLGGGSIGGGTGTYFSKETDFTPEQKAYLKEVMEEAIESHSRVPHDVSLSKEKFNAELKRLEGDLQDVRSDIRDLRRDFREGRGRREAQASEESRPRRAGRRRDVPPPGYPGGGGSSPD